MFDAVVVFEETLADLDHFDEGLQDFGGAGEHVSDQDVDKCY